VSPKCDLDDPAPNFFVPRTVELRVALYFVTFLGYFERRAVNTATFYELKGREMISTSVRTSFFLRNFQTGSGTHPGSRLLCTETSVSRSKSTEGLEPIAYVHAMRG
jgi:hypothetical protein